MKRLLDGMTYRVPDGRIFKAKQEQRRYSPEPAWTLVPLDLHDSDSWLESLEQLLFFESGKIVFFDFSGAGPKVKDSGWSAGDLVPISN